MRKSFSRPEIKAWFVAKAVRVRFSLVLFPLSLVVLSLSACFTANEHVTPQTRYIVVDRQAPIPPGVVRYCWEEPMVDLEPNGPGLDDEARWYHPFYFAVREVRQGKWRPCRPVPSEAKGEEKNNER